nr:hypothetical protein [uncultured Mediterraneibacter sp.]
MITSVKDTQLRKAAKRRGILLKKSRKGVIDNRGGYMLVDVNNTIIAGEKFELMPEDVRKWLNQSKNTKDL